MDNGGSALIEEAELAKSPETNDEVVELAKYHDDKSVLSENHPDKLDITAEQAERSSLFTDEEVEEIRRNEDQFTEEELSRSDKVRSHIEDPTTEASNLRELWLEICRENGIFGMGEIEEYSSKEEAIKSQLKNRDWVEDSDPKVKDMNASDFADLIANAQNENEELEESSVEFEKITNEDNSDIEISELDDETVQELSDSWQSKSHVFAEMAQDIKKSQEIPDTNIETVSDGIKRITTSFDELKADLWQLHNDESKQTKIIDKSGDTIVAKAHTGEKV